jgi:uncharacterized OB-fold protein
VSTDERAILLPQPDAVTQGFWDAAKRHELAIQECVDCGTLRHPPQAMCTECGSERFSWRTMSGRGTLYSYVIVHQTALPAFRDAVPYNLVMVALDDAPQIRLHGNVVDFDDEQLKVGLSVTVVFDDITPDDTLIRWRVVEPDA